MRYMIAATMLVFAACGSPEEPPAKAVAAPSAAKTLTGAAPIVIAHRGASGERPEHTIAAYELAIEQGADFIEPDLVMTKDGVLIARHDLYLSTTTDVADRPEFADRRRPGPEAGGARDDWWAEDFTLEDIKTLRARQPFEGRSDAFDGLYEVPTFAEILALAARHGVGVYPETKSPSHHASIGLEMETPLLASLDGHAGAVFIQSFEPGILRSLNQKSDWPLVQLLSGDPRAVAAGLEPPLEQIAAYADGLGPNKALLWTPEGAPSDFVARAHGLGLQVHPWTYRDDRVGVGFDGVDAELAATFDQGVDGVFTDFPATALIAR